MQLLVRARTLSSPATAPWPGTYRYKCADDRGCSCGFSLRSGKHICDTGAHNTRPAAAEVRLEHRGLDAERSDAESQSQLTFRKPSRIDHAGTAGTLERPIV